VQSIAPHAPDRQPDVFIKDGAQLKDIPYDATNVEVAGVPVVALYVASQGRHSPIPDLSRTLRA
jgi:hypothetical protein